MITSGPIDSILGILQPATKVYDTEDGQPLTADENDQAVGSRDQELHRDLKGTTVAATRDLL